MNLSKFTQDNIKQFEKCKYNLTNESKLVKLIRTERNKIIKFIKTNPSLIIKKNKIDNLDKKLCDFSNTSWVDTESVVNQINSIDNNYQYQWNSIIDSDDKPIINYINIKSDKLLEKSMNNKIKIIIYQIEYLKYSNNVNKPVNIFLVLTNLKKEFPENNQPIGIKNANSGYTDFSKKIIYIWRAEELEKVILHEIFHYLDMDNRDHHVDHIININGPHSYFEAITDFWAILYHLIFVSILSKKSIKLLLNIELGFIKNQAMCLNHFFKLGNWKDLSNNTINQASPVFSYYIIKFMIFEYSINNEMTYRHYNDLITSILDTGFTQKPYVKIKSSRMTLIGLD